MNVKDYRTPQGLRTFARFYVIAMWPIMGPYFAWVKDMTGMYTVSRCFLSATVGVDPQRARQ